MAETDKYFSAADDGTHPEKGSEDQWLHGGGGISRKWDIKGRHGKYRFTHIRHKTGNGFVRFCFLIIHAALWKMYLWC